MIDLHTHSTASDGTVAPGSLVELVKEKGFEAFALTDHDTVAGLAEAGQRAHALDVTFLPGIELSATTDGLGDLHILGYAIDSCDTTLLAACERLRSARRTRARRLVDRLNALGVHIEFGRVAAHARGGSIGRPHVARALVEAGHAPSFKEAFNRWLVPGAPAYIHKERLDALAAVNMIQRAGGVAVLAHPGTLRLTSERLEELVGRLEAHGLLGIEAYWAKHSEEDVRLSEDLARRYHLVATGGSDFHGANKPGIELGMAAGNRELPPEMLVQLMKRKREAFA